MRIYYIRIALYRSTVPNAGRNGVGIRRLGHRERKSHRGIKELVLRVNSRTARLVNRTQTRAVNSPFGVGHCVIRPTYWPGHYGMALPSDLGTFSCSSSIRPSHQHSSGGLAVMYSFPESISP